MQKSSKVIRNKSQINYSYATIEITQSRIDKGLIAIPRSLSKWFPDHNDTIEVHLNDSLVSQSKHYSSYTSRIHECRIGGLREWFQQNNVKSKDKIIVQFIDKERFVYRLVPERNFISNIKELQCSFDNSTTEQEASERISTLSQWTQLEKDKVVLNEYLRLIDISPYKSRRYVEKSLNRTRESVPANLRILLEGIYKGYCQVCDFWFMKRDKNPYFEIHHLYPWQEHHPKNLLVVCGNCHNQFEYANVKQDFNANGWLINVSFNENIHSVKQIVVTTKLEGFFRDLFI